MQEENPEQKSQKGIGAVVVVVIVALIIIAGFAGFTLLKSSNQTPVPNPQPTNSESIIKDDKTATPGAENAVMAKDLKITISGEPFSFTPSTISVKKGQKVTIVFKNTGGFHNFVIDEFDVKTETIASGKSIEVSFTPDKAGTFEFYCSVGNHRAMGMKGTLTVTE